MNTLIWLAVSLHLWGCLLVVCRHSDFVDGDWIESHCYHLAWKRDLTQPFFSSWDGEGGGPGSWVSCCPQTGSVRRRPVSSCLASSEAATSSRWTVSPWSTNLNMNHFTCPVVSGRLNRGRTVGRLPVDPKTLPGANPRAFGPRWARVTQVCFKQEAGSFCEAVSTPDLSLIPH